MDLEEMNYHKELVPLGKKLGIFRPNSKPKAQLIRLIQQIKVATPAENQGTAGITDGGGEFKGASPPPFQAQIIIEENADIIMLKRLADNKVIALLHLKGSLGPGRKPYIMRIREIAMEMDLTLDPAILIQV